MSLGRSLDPRSAATPGSRDNGVLRVVPKEVPTCSARVLPVGTATMGNRY